MTSRPKTGMHRAAAAAVALAALASACGGASKSVEAGTTAPLTTAVPDPVALTTPVPAAVVPAAVVPAAVVPTTLAPTAPMVKPTPTPTTPTVKPTPTPDANAASQSPGDAARDGVVPAFAALPLKVRMSVRSSVVAPEGVWVASRPTPEADKSAVGCRIGPEEGQTPADWICTSEYGEILLLDKAKTRILRAYPLAGVPPQFLRLTANALYCGRPGDGGLLPDSMACRIDRHTLAATIRVFPGEPDSVVVQPCFTPPASWTIADHYLPVSDLAADGKGVRVKGADGQWLNLDPLTLEGRQ